MSEKIQTHPGTFGMYLSTVREFNQAETERKATPCQQVLWPALADRPLCCFANFFLQSLLLVCMLFMKSCRQEHIPVPLEPSILLQRCCKWLKFVQTRTHSRFLWNRPFCFSGVANYKILAVMNPPSVPLEPTILLRRCCSFVNSCPQEPTLGFTGTDHFASEVLQIIEVLAVKNPLLVPLEPTILLRRCCSFVNSCPQEPTLGSTGTDHFASEVL